MTDTLVTATPKAGAPMTDAPMTDGTPTALIVEGPFQPVGARSVASHAAIFRRKASKRRS
jgi:hypothetical protein